MPTRTKNLPELKTERFDLIPPKIAHAKDVFLYGNDKEFCRFIDAKPFPDVGAAEAFLHGLAREIELGTRVYWAIRDRAEGRVIGTMGFIWVSQRHRIAEFGFGIARESWGQGTFGECAFRLFEFGKQNLAIERLEVITRIDNKNAIRASQKVGFTEEAVLQGYYRPNGCDGRIDAMLMCKLL